MKSEKQIIVSVGINTDGNAQVPEEKLQKSSTEVFLQQASTHMNHCLDVAAHCSFKSMSSNILMLASKSPTPSELKNWS